MNVHINIINNSLFTSWCHVTFSFLLVYLQNVLFSNKWKLSLILLPHFRFCLAFLQAYTNWKSNNFQSIQTVSPGSSPSQTQGWPYNSQHTESLSSLLVYTSESNESRLCSCCCSCSCCWLLLLYLGSRSQLSSSQWTVHQSISLSFHAVPHIGYFPASRQIAVEEHKRWAVSMWCRRRERGVLARTPPLCGCKETYLVPGGGLFTRLTLTSAKSPL